nr:hypothetical protein [Tanacetum cinerariifolium]
MKQIRSAQVEACKEENIGAEIFVGEGEPFEVRSDGPEMIREMTEMIVQIKNRLLTARSRQKSYADVKRKPLEFEVGDKVMLKVSPWKGPVAYKLELPRELQGIHNTFHVSNLKKCLSDEDLIIPFDEEATAPVDAENWISHMEKIFDVMGCEDAFKTRLAVYKFEDFKKLFFLQFFPRAEQERLKREYHSIRQTNTETSTEFMQHFLRLAGFLGAAAGTEEEQANNFQWVLRRSTLNHLMCMSYTDVAQVANAARNYEILHERDDEDTERSDKRTSMGMERVPRSNKHQQMGRNVTPDPLKLSLHMGRNVTLDPDITTNG